MKVFIPAVPQFFSDAEFAQTTARDPVALDTSI
jgi:hypothetical protein